MNLKQIKELSKQVEQLISYRERDFFASIISRLESGKKELTDGQIWYLNIIKKKYNDDALAEHKKWISEFSNEQRDIANKVALYYNNTPYFPSYVNTVLSDPENFIFTQQQWKVFCENKYAQKIRSCYEEPLKFKVADCVQVRATNCIDVANCSADGFPNKKVRYLFANKVGFILEIDAKPVTRAAKGSRIYKVLFIGETAPVYAHEADLKRKRGK